MTDDTMPTRQAIAAKDRSSPLKVTGRLRHAVELMIWQGHSRDEAAAAAGLKPKSLYNAFRKHHVRAFFRAELGALRESAHAKNFHHLEKIAAESANDMARVSAIKTMSAIAESEEHASTGGRITQPGMTILIVQPAAIPPAIDVTPERDPVANHGSKP